MKYHRIQRDVRTIFASVQHTLVSLNWATLQRKRFVTCTYNPNQKDYVVVKKYLEAMSQQLTFTTAAAHAPNPPLGYIGEEIETNIGPFPITCPAIRCRVFSDETCSMFDVRFALAKKKHLPKRIPSQVPNQHKYFLFLYSMWYYFYFYPSSGLGQPKKKKEKKKKREKKIS